MCLSMLRSCDLFLLLITLCFLRRPYVDYTTRHSIWERCPCSTSLPLSYLTSVITILSIHRRGVASQQHIHKYLKKSWHVYIKHVSPSGIIMYVLKREWTVALTLTNACFFIQFKEQFLKGIVKGRLWSNFYLALNPTEPNCMVTTSNTVLGTEWFIFCCPGSIICRCEMYYVQHILLWSLFIPTCDKISHVQPTYCKCLCRNVNCQSWQSRL